MSEPYRPMGGGSVPIVLERASGGGKILLDRERKRTMKRKSGGLVVALTLAVAVGVSPIEGQRGAGFGGRGGGPYAGRSLDVIIENQEALGLTGDQLAQIQQLKGVMDSEVAPLADEIRALRTRIRAGELERNDGLRELQALQGQMTTAAAPLRGRVQEILTVEQHRQLQATVWQTRPGRGRGGAVGGRGGWGMARGQVRGSRGGFGPRQGFNGQGRGPASGFRTIPPGAPFRNRGFRGPDQTAGPGGSPSVETGNLFRVR